MHPEATGTINKTIKRRNRIKKRNKQKQQRRRTTSQTSQQSCQQQQQNQKQNISEQLHCRQKEHKRSIHVWRQAYENAVRWHCEHQMNFWRQRAEQLQLENAALRNAENSKIQEVHNEEQEEYETSPSEYETSDEEEIVEEKFEVDEEYLSFLEITHKHQTELKLSRQQLENEN